MIGDLLDSQSRSTAAISTNMKSPKMKPIAASSSAGASASCAHGQHIGTAEAREPRGRRSLRSKDFQSRRGEATAAGHFGAGLMPSPCARPGLGLPWISGRTTPSTAASGRWAASTKNAGMGWFWSIFGIVRALQVVSSCCAVTIDGGHRTHELGQVNP